MKEIKTMKIENIPPQAPLPFFNFFAPTLWYIFFSILPSILSIRNERSFELILFPLQEVKTHQKVLAFQENLTLALCMMSPFRIRTNNLRTGIHFVTCFIPALLDQPSHDPLTPVRCQLFPCRSDIPQPFDPDTRPLFPHSLSLVITVPAHQTLATASNNIMQHVAGADAMFV